MKRAVMSIAVLLVTIPVMAQDADQKPSLVVCYTTGSVNRRQAKKATNSMLGVLEGLAGWKQGSYQSEFTSKSKECLDLLKQKTTHFISPSLGFFLKHRKEYGLIPIARPRVQGRTTDRWYLIVRKGSFQKLDDLKGKTLGGPLVDDVEFLRRVVFKGRIDPASFFVLKRSSRVLRSLRKPAKGKLDAVLVNQQQYEALPSLPFAKDLVPVFKSDPMPIPSLLAVKSRTTARERKDLAKAFAAFCKTPKGKGFCQMFGIDTFEPVQEKEYRAVEKVWSDSVK